MADVPFIGIKINIGNNIICHRTTKHWLSCNCNTILEFVKIPNMHLQEKKINEVKW